MAVLGSLYLANWLASGGSGPSGPPSGWPLTRPALKAERDAHRRRVEELRREQSVHPQRAVALTVLLEEGLYPTPDASPERAGVMDGGGDTAAVGFPVIPTDPEQLQQQLAELGRLKTTLGADLAPSQEDHRQLLQLLLVHHRLAFPQGTAGGEWVTFDRLPEVFWLQLQRLSVRGAVNQAERPYWRLIHHR